MTLFLAAEGKDPESIVKLRAFVPDLSTKHIVYIPTANNYQTRGGWRSGESFRVVSQLTNQLTILELEDYQTTDIISVIKSADILWMQGGQTSYLLKWLHQSGLAKALPSLLSGDLLYVGSSAGSMACSQTNHFAVMFPGEEDPDAGNYPGLGLIDFEIFPHYEEKYLQFLEETWHHGELYLLKNGEVIVVKDGQIEVLGEKRIINKKLERAHAV